MKRKGPDTSSPNPDIMYSQDVAAALGFRSPRAPRRMAERYPDFPPPFYRMQEGRGRPCWWRVQVESWIAKTFGSPSALEETRA